MELVDEEGGSCLRTVPSDSGSFTTILLLFLASPLSCGYSELSVCQAVLLRVQNDKLSLSSPISLGFQPSGLGCLRHSSLPSCWLNSIHLPRQDPFISRSLPAPRPLSTRVFTVAANASLSLLTHELHCWRFWGCQAAIKAAHSFH